MKSTGTERAPESHAPSVDPASGVRTSVSPRSVSRVCKSCGTGLDGKPRSKNVDGEYRCMACHRRRKSVRDAVKNLRQRVGRFGYALAVAVVMCGALFGVMRGCNEPSLTPADSP